MTWYPCDVCGIERCGGCCSKCDRSSEKCVCAERLAKDLKDFADYELESELKRRKNERKQNQLKLKQKDLEKLKAEVRKLESELKQ